MPHRKKPSYRKEAFTHWANVAFLVTGGVAGAVVDPIIWALMAPVELGILWALPDFPLFKLWADKRFDNEEALKEREYYLEQLWGLKEREIEGLGGWLGSLFFEAPDDLDERVIRRSSPDFRHYLEMRDIIKKLRELVHVRGVRLSEPEIARFEMVINGYLRLLIACRPLAKALESSDRKALEKELRSVEAKLKTADRSVAPVFRERQKLLQDQIDRLPKVRALLELMRTRADALVYQLRNIHSHVLADPGTDVTDALDDILTRQEMMIDPLGELAADQMVDDFLARPSTKAFLDRAETDLQEETHRRLEAVRAAQAGRQRQ